MANQTSFVAVPTTYGSDRMGFVMLPKIISLLA
jgi:hypothetical protein